MSQHPLVIKTSRDGLVLKQLMPDDASAYFELLDEDREHLSQHNDKTAKKYPYEAIVRDSIMSPSNPYKMRFGIWDGDTFVGMVGLKPLGNRIGETGGWTGKRFCRMGYATVTRRALATFAIKKLGYRRIVAETHPKNTESQEMLIKVGFKLVERRDDSHHFIFVPEK